MRYSEGVWLFLTPFNKHENSEGVDVCLYVAKKYENIVPQVCQHHFVKCDINILAIELLYIIQYLPNGSSIPLDS
jgi:hypothetical protein